tara:strand:+ start:208 stop:429 length:222 start_codon:yes stop_codon:yes gene_type:complete
MKTFKHIQNATLNIITLFVYSMALRVLIDIWKNNAEYFSFVEVTYATATSIFCVVIGWFLLLINIAVWKEDRA